MMSVTTMNKAGFDSPPSVQYEHKTQTDFKGKQLTIVKGRDALAIKTNGSVRLSTGVIGEIVTFITTDK